MKKSISMLCLAMITLGSSAILTPVVGASTYQERTTLVTKSNIEKLKVDSYTGDWENDYINPNPVKAWKNIDLGKFEIHGEDLSSVEGLVFEGHLNVVGQQTGKVYYSKDSGLLEPIPSVDVILDSKDVVDDTLEVTLSASWQGSGPIGYSFASAVVHIR